MLKQVKTVPVLKAPLLNMKQGKPLALSLCD